MLAPDIDMDLLAGSVVARIVPSTQVAPRSDRLTQFGVKRGGEGGSITLVHFLQKVLLNMVILGVFGRFCFSPFLLPKSNVYHRFHNFRKIRGGGQTPYGRFP